LLRAALTDLTDTTMPIDGSFGPKTGNAVTRFQTAEHLTADGSIGPATWQKLLTG
jgi:peptidoglycan hydrolase-like protein with peptidoglycan-binding domain